MDGTVREASLEEGRPERCGTPDGDGVGATTGAVRGSCLVSVDTVLPSVWFFCIVLLVAAGLAMAAGLAGATGAGLRVGVFAAADDLASALLAAGGDFLAAVLVGVEAAFGLVADLVAVLVALGAALPFAGMAFTS